MAIPSFPSNLFRRVFASGGNFKTIPDTGTAAGRGRASQELGFPEETQLPLSSGGLAPNRTDFNGIFNMLSGLAFWQQSGGLALYQPSLNYTLPSVVFHAGALWWCKAANGPDAPAGQKTPGASPSHWVEFLPALAEMGGASSMFGNPVGTVITYYGTSAPVGYLACNGASFSATNYPLLRAVLGAAVLPDLRGYFVRGYDTRDTVDPGGKNRALGSKQEDAGRKVSGQHYFGVDANSHLTPQPTGSFYYGQVWADNIDFLTWTNYRTANIWAPLGLDSTREWGAAHVAAEFRPANVALLYCIKHD